MTHLLYSYKATEDDGEELRYSLRSIAKNLHMGPVSVTVAGDCPTWWRGHYFPGNPTDDKATNMLANVGGACRMLSDNGVTDAIYLSDDYLLMFPQEDVMPLTTGDLLALCKSTYIQTKPRTDWYRVAIERTYSLLIDFEVPQPLSFELHLPLPLDTEKASQSLKLFLDMEGPKPFWRTIYGNLVGFDRQVHQTDDVLYYGQSPVKIGAPWVSPIPSQWTGFMRRRALRMFPDPSPWETT